MTKVICALILALTAGLHSEEWRIAPDSLLTSWAKEVSPENCRPEYPRPTMSRAEWANLNGLWDYAITSKSVERPPSAYLGKILVPYPIESALSGVKKPLDADQRLWYRRSFSVPKEWASQRLYLRFGAVDWSTQVFLDGRSLGTHRGGYDSFSFEISEACKNEGPHELVVSVVDPTDAGWQLRGKQARHPGGAFYTATSGIWQTVWLEPVPMSSIDGVRLIPDVASESLRVTVDARTVPAAFSIHVTVLDGGREFASASGSLHNEMTKDVVENLTWYKAKRIWASATLDISMKGAKLWTPDSPFLYDLKIELKSTDGTVVDTVGSYVGMRTIAVGHDKQNTVPLLNGKPIYFQGALDQGFWPDGIYTAATDDALRFDVEAAKKLGLNTIRKHIKVEPERYYYWCDRLGLMVIQDMPSGKDGNSFTDESSMPEAAMTAEMERRTLIQQRWNHSSIVCWTLFNEGWGQHDTLRHAKWAKELDPTRLVCETSGFPRHGGGDVLDCHGGIPPRDPKRISIDSETAGFGLTVPGHAWPGTGWATGTYDAASNAITKGKYDALYPLDERAKRWYTKEVEEFYAWLRKHWESTGVTGNFKVQLYDVENEENGMLSYDRAVWKVDPDVVRAAATGDSASKPPTPSKEP